MSNYLMQRDGIYYYMRRVPDVFSQYDCRKFVRSSLSTRDKRTAIRKSIEFNDFLEAYWRSLTIEGKNDPSADYQLAVKRAKICGFTYKSAEDISSESTEKIVERVLAAVKTVECPETTSAILGGKEPPKLFLDQLWDEYYSFKKSDLLGKSKKQLIRWENPRIRAYKTFIKVCGDIPIQDISRDHLLKFRGWWAKRLENADMAPNSANKDLTHLRTLLAYAQDNKAEATFDVNSLFARLRFREKESERKPFKTSYIADTLLNEANLRGLNKECRLFLFAMADTGARPSELLGLNAERGDIRLDTEIPYIHIRPDKDREIKNQYSNRQIPLVGASLYAFQQLQGGFNRYYRRPDQLSGNLNNFLRDHNLLPTKEHTVYSLRHSFEDRLSLVETPEKVQSFIMGHKYRRERYGAGPTLEQKRKWLEMICFDTN